VWLNERERRFEAGYAWFKDQLYLSVGYPHPAKKTVTVSETPYVFSDKIMENKQVIDLWYNVTDLE
jgi:hypothetical protein